MDLRSKLHDLINTADDTLLQSIDAFIEKQQANDSLLTNEQWEEIDRRREAYLAEEGETYTLKDFKKELGKKLYFIG